MFFVFLRCLCNRAAHFFRDLSTFYCMGDLNWGILCSYSLIIDEQGLSTLFRKIF